ncbi:MAG: glycoside hydrolase family 9 protein [Lachnospiraceae bacterium]|nr:glycoside hydrolase family 9 protein [Lachnospiraceae bacterium]
MHLDINKGYFSNDGINVMVFDDIYPAGHQSGIGIIMHGKRIATNGDLRFEQTPGQWQPTPKQIDRTMDEKNDTVKVTLVYPDDEGNLKGMNPMIYPDVDIKYHVRVHAEDESVFVTLDLEDPIPEIYASKACFNLELFPGELFGKPWIMDDQQGIFPRQVNGPVKIQPSNFSHSGHHTVKPDKDNYPANRELLAGLPTADSAGYSKDASPAEYNPIIADDMIAFEYASGKTFTLCPDDPYMRLRIECLSDDTGLKLYDGRLNHNNGWFVISSEIPTDRTGCVLKWKITPNSVPEWRYDPVIQISQVGFHPDQRKYAVIELDARQKGKPLNKSELYRLTENGEKKVSDLLPAVWGNYLRYHYLILDFTDIKTEGLYRVYYGKSRSDLFKISGDIYDRGVWQPVLEYFLPVQMCHMRVNEKYRVWHGLCHKDDARMAKTAFNHFDGYKQGASTLTKYKPGDAIPGLNKGGWHDAGDFDLRVESQAGESYILSLAYEEFHVDYDATTIDQDRQLVEIHEPDGKNDILQQIEHGLLSVLGGYHALGRLYRGIICNSLRQYVLLGDPAAMTDGVPSDDDRWVFTEENPFREYQTAAQIAACARSMRGYNDSLSEDCIKVSSKIYNDCSKYDLTGYENPEMIKTERFHAATELYITTKDDKYKKDILNDTTFILEHIYTTGWIVARLILAFDDPDFKNSLTASIPSLAERISSECSENPYGIPYHPYIWGAGWGIQAMAKQYYFLHKAFPEIFDRAPLENALNFILGCHPGSNTSSFASGVGTRSATTAYGLNRADWSYIPGGVISGTALIRPDFPELLEFPYLWQQTEYVLGGGSSNYMFMVLAVQNLLNY